MDYNNYNFQFHYWSTRPESKLRKEIKREKSQFRKADLEQIYIELKRTGVYKKMKENKKNKNKDI